MFPLISSLKSRLLVYLFLLIDTSYLLENLIDLTIFKEINKDNIAVVFLHYDSSNLFARFTRRA